MEIGAFYFPNYHRDARNEARYGKGWTEWELLKAARPRYPGQQQPKEPAWGYFDESDPALAAREIDLAADHGLTAFLYDWYWYGDKPFLQGGLEEGFLQAPNNARLKFGLMWANHDWYDLFPAGPEKAPLLERGRVNAAEFGHLTDYCLRHYFGRPNYLKFDGRPYFCIYELGTFIDGLGGVGKAVEALDRFRAKALQAGHPGLHLQAMVWGFSVLPGELATADPAALAERLGLSSVGTYAWVHHFEPGRSGFPKGDYAQAFRANAQAWQDCSARFKIPYHPNVSMGWDPSPRTRQSEAYEPRGYPWTAVLDGNSPERFEEALRAAREFVEGKKTPQAMISINAWNEWTEGSYLLPDKLNGMAYLQALKRVFA